VHVPQDVRLEDLLTFARDTRHCGKVVHRSDTIFEFERRKLLLYVVHDGDSEDLEAAFLRRFADADEQCTRLPYTLVHGWIGFHELLRAFEGHSTEHLRGAALHVDRCQCDRDRDFAASSPVRHAIALTGEWCEIGLCHLLPSALSAGMGGATIPACVRGHADCNDRDRRNRRNHASTSRSLHFYLALEPRILTVVS
jgi:hypothetical protein